MGSSTVNRDAGLPPTCTLLRNSPVTSLPSCIVTCATLPRSSSWLYCEYEIWGAASFDPDIYVNRVPASRTSSTQKESCFEALPHLPGPFGFCGIGIGITANSRCTANGGSSPRDPTHTPQETH